MEMAPALSSSLEWLISGLPFVTAGMLLLLLLLATALFFQPACPCFSEPWWISVGREEEDRARRRGVDQTFCLLWEAVARKIPKGGLRAVLRDCT